MVATRRITRSKRRFRTARAAWSDIHRRTGRRAASVIRTAHTRLSWVFVVRSRRRR